MQKLSVVVPAYNEEANLEKCIQNIQVVLRGLKTETEVIIVDDGSKDKTGAVADALAKKHKNVVVVHNRSNRGYGGSLKAGFTAARNDLIVMFHADNQFDFKQLPNLLEKLEETDADLASGIRVQDSDPLSRRINRWGWNTIVRALFGYLATDVDCGFKVFKREVLEKISLPSDGAMLDTELYAGMRARGMRIVEMPVKHLPRIAGKSTGGNPKVILKAFRELAAFWWQLKQEIMVEQGKAVFKWEAMGIVVILLIAAFVRLYKIDGYMTFLGDEGRDVSVVRDMLLGRKFTLIGPGTSIGNMYLGPLYYYLMLAPLLIFNFSPVGPAVMVAVFGVSTVFLLWWIGRQWFGRYPALMVSILYAVSPTVIMLSRSSWNPNIMPFFALLTMYGVWKVWRLGYWRWLIISAVSFAFVLQSHYLGLLLLPTTSLFVFLAYRKFKKSKKNIYLLSSIIIFLILMSPLLLFDLRHNWTNFRAVTNFFADRQTTVNLKAYKALPNFWPIWVDINSSLVAAKNYPLAVLTAVYLLLSLYLLYKHRSKDLLFVLVWLGFGLVGLGLYKQHIYDHYYGFLFPMPFLMLGFVMADFKRVSTLLVLLLLAVNLYNSPLRYHPNNQLAHTKEISRFIKDQTGGQPFNLALLAKQNYDMGYRYFLDLNGSEFRTIHQQLAEQLFVICEEPVCEPIGNSLWEIAAFGWAKVDSRWEFPWGVQLFRLVHNPTGK